MFTFLGSCCNHYDYLKYGLKASARVEVELYAYLPGKSGCHVALYLGDGSRRFSTSLHKLLLGIENRKFKCTVKRLLFLNLARAEEYKEKLREELDELFSVSGIAMSRIKEVKDILLQREDFEKEGGKERLMDEAFRALEAAIDYQKRAEPVIENLLAVLQGKASWEDYHRIYDSFKPFIYD